MAGRLHLARLAAAALLVVLSGTAEARRGDIQPHKLFFLAGKDAAHETITEKGYQRVPEPLRNTIKKKELINGVIYNDMPGKDMLSVAGVAKFGIEFFKAMTKHQLNSIVARSHFGCNQRYHAQTPVGSIPVSNLEPEEQAELAKANIKELSVIYTNAGTLQTLIDIAKYWWMQAVGEYGRTLLCPNGEGPNTPGKCGIPSLANWNEVASRGSWMNKLESWLRTQKWALEHLKDRLIGRDDLSDNFIGHIVHMIEDSFAMGHTLRDRSGPKKCGKVLLFTGYGVQENNEFHGDMDHDPFVTQLTHRAEKNRNLDRRRELYNCAIEAIVPLLERWGTCKQRVHEIATSLMTNQLEDRQVRDLKLQPCVFDPTVVTNVIAVDPHQANEPGGGSPWIAAGAMCKDKKCSTNPVDIAKRVAATPGVHARVIQYKYTDDNGQGGPISECEAPTIDTTNGRCNITIIEPSYSVANLNAKFVEGTGTLDMASLRAAIADSKAKGTAVALRSSDPSFRRRYMGCLGQIGAAAENPLNGQDLHRELADYEDRLSFSNMFIPDNTLSASDHFTGAVALVSKRLRKEGINPATVTNAEIERMALQLAKETAEREIQEQQQPQQQPSKHRFARLHRVELEVEHMLND